MLSCVMNTGLGVHCITATKK